MNHLFKNFLLVVITLSYSFISFAGAESSAGYPMQPIKPTEPFEYKCNLTYIADVPESYGSTNLSETTVTLNNEKTFVNLQDLKWTHYRSSYLVPNKQKLSATEKPNYSFAGSGMGIYFDYAPENNSAKAKYIAVLNASVYAPSKEPGNSENAEAETRALEVVGMRINVAAKLRRAYLSKTNYLYLGLFADCQKTK